MSVGSLDGMQIVITIAEPVQIADESVCRRLSALTVGLHTPWPALAGPGTDVTE